MCFVSTSHGSGRLLTCSLPFQGRAGRSGRGLQLLAEVPREYRQQELDTLPGLMDGPRAQPWATAGSTWMYVPQCRFYLQHFTSLLHQIPFRMGKHSLELTLTLRKTHALDFGSDSK